MKIEKIKVDEIIPYADNAKLHPERQIEQIRSSILEFGFNDPIAIDENNVVIEGNGRLMAIKDLGFKEVDCFDTDIDTGDGTKYTQKVDVPQYEPTGECPDIWDLCDSDKADSFLDEIEEADITDDEKTFLIKATKRLYEFNYSKIAEYYSHATPEMQELMEHLALVIIDFDNAIAYGYAQLSAALEEMRAEDEE